MAKAISNRNVLDAKFDIADFSGKWLEAFGKPELRGAWIIYGESGSGKTHFALQLLKYLSGFVNRAAYDTLEQGLSLSFQNAWKDVAMQEVGSRVIVLAKEPITELRERLRAAGLPVVDIHELKERAERITGVPAPLPVSDRVVAKVISRDGELLDTIRQTDNRSGI